MLLIPDLQFDLNTSLLHHPRDGAAVNILALVASCLSHEVLSVLVVVTTVVIIDIVMFYHLDRHGVDFMARIWHSPLRDVESLVCLGKCRMFFLEDILDTARAPGAVLLHLD